MKYQCGELSLSLLYYQWKLKLIVHQNYKMQGKGKEFSTYLLSHKEKLDENL